MSITAIDNLPPVHPGEIMRDELEVLSMSAYGDGHIRSKSMRRHSRRTQTRQCEAPCKTNIYHYSTAARIVG